MPVLFISGVATSVSEWKRFHSLTLVATLHQAESSAGLLACFMARCRLEACATHQKKLPLGRGSFES
jgi:hypothetical protein